MTTTSTGVTTAFAEFYCDVWGPERPPFPWQVRLAEQVLTDGRWPEVIDLPTGAGKTSVLDVAVFALAMDPARFARRIVFVVDRRVVVDQVSEHAQALAGEIANGTTPAVRAIRQSLIELGGDPDNLLALEALRGGKPRADHWARWPDQPAVLASTVDQFGSRLLFRGYGVTRSMRPVHAGLAGNDCLVLLDEVHLAVPFAQTLAAVDEASPASSLPRRWQVVQMSATPVVADGQTRFQLDPDLDLDPGESAELVQRMRAHKPAALALVGKKSEAADKVLAREVPKLVARSERHSIGIVVNRVASARAVANSLKAAGENTLLITGRMRPHDRDAVVGRLMDVAGAARPETGADDTVAPGERTVVVATQCIEVGADLSFEELITEAAPLDALRQRFGRLDRRGASSAAGTPAPATIIGVRSVVEATRPDPVYGNALANTWAALREAFGDESFDVGPMSAELEHLMAHHHVADLCAPTTTAPLLLPVHLDTFSQTGPEPPIGPDPVPFLHGFRDVDTDVFVLWRADLGDFPTATQLARGDVTETADLIRAALEHAPPDAGELLQLPIASVRRWLGGLDDPTLADAPGESGDDVGRPLDTRVGFRWRAGAPADSGFLTGSDLTPGDTVVVPSTYGGLEDGNWSPGAEEPVVDVGSRSISTRTLRLHPAVIGATVGLDPEAATNEEVLEAVADGGWFDQFDPFDPTVWRVDRYQAWQATGNDGRTGQWIEYFVLARRRLTAAQLDGSDDTNSFMGDAPRPAYLNDHLRGVGDLAAEVASRCGLSPALVEDLRLAGELHDLGKVDPRFQRWLHGSELSLARHRQPLAKSLRRTSSAERRVRREQAGYPAGMRHELLSVALVHDSADLAAMANDWDLVVHLVASHHGHCRPLPPVVVDSEPVVVDAEVRGVALRACSALDPPVSGTGSVDRFWRLTERYGHHGLAWLEAIFRLADHRRSEKEANGDV